MKKAKKIVKTKATLVKELKKSEREKRFLTTRESNAETIKRLIDICS